MNYLAPINVSAEWVFPKDGKLNTSSIAKRYHQSPGRIAVARYDGERQVSVLPYFE